MSACSVSFHLVSTFEGYNLQMNFHHFKTQKEIPFCVKAPSCEGATWDLYSQNGKVNADQPLSCFKTKDLQGVKKAFKCIVPQHQGKVQTLFVLDLQDVNGEYEDLESIRQG